MSRTEKPTYEEALRDAFALRAFTRMVRDHKRGTDHRVSIGVEVYALADAAMHARRLTTGRRPLRGGR